MSEERKKQLEEAMKRLCAETGATGMIVVSLDDNGVDYAGQFPKRPADVVMMIGGLLKLLEEVRRQGAEGASQPPADGTKH